MDFKVINKSVLLCEGKRKVSCSIGGKTGLPARRAEMNRGNRLENTFFVHTSVARSLGKSVHRFVYF